MAPLEVYCKEILHSGCALVQGKHSWEECDAKYVYERIAVKHQTTLKGLGLAIGTWVDANRYELKEKGK